VNHQDTKDTKEDKERNNPQMTQMTQMKEDRFLIRLYLRPSASSADKPLQRFPWCPLCLGG